LEVDSVKGGEEEKKEEMPIDPSGDIKIEFD